MTEDLHLRRRLEALRNEYAVRSLTARGGSAEIAALEEAHLRDEMAVLTAELGAGCAIQVRSRPTTARALAAHPPARLTRYLLAGARAILGAATRWFDSWHEIQGRAYLPPEPPRS